MWFFCRAVALLPPPKHTFCVTSRRQQSHRPTFLFPIFTQFFRRYFSLRVGVHFAEAALSETAARIFKAPSTLFLIMGVYPLVPGAGIYKTAALILQNNVQEALVTGNATAAELLFMAAGIAVVSALFKLKSHNT